MPKNFVALPCVRRCGLRAVIVAAECPRTSLLCHAYAAVGYALPSLHPNAPKYKKKFNALLAARTSLWTACSVLTFSTGAWPRVSLWTTSVFEDKTLLEQTPKCAAWADAVLVAD